MCRSAAEIVIAATTAKKSNSFQLSPLCGGAIFYKNNALLAFFFISGALLYIERTRKKAKMAALKSNNGARYLNLYEPLCGVVEYVIVNPTWRPDFNLVESKLNPELQDFIY